MITMNAKMGNETEELMLDEMYLQMEVELPKVNRFPANPKLKGWYWEESEGYGILYDNKGKPHFEYDMNSYNGCAYLCEYRETKTGIWKNFIGTMGEFYRYAEKIAMEEIAGKEKSE